ncbi:unnamed protein product [Linum trigynum]|uniref:Uncharacterized protein n=1 Tax=Linum trigynum TaxID=586398 RepID=A0AAV2DMM5_9ROSI
MFQDLRRTFDSQTPFLLSHCKLITCHDSLCSSGMNACTRNLEHNMGCWKSLRSLTVMKTIHNGATELIHGELML